MELTTEYVEAERHREVRVSVQGRWKQKGERRRAKGSEVTWGVSLFLIPLTICYTANQVLVLR